MKELLNSNIYEDTDFKYRLLRRLKMDCEYYLGNGNRYSGHLWSNNAKDHIEDMKALYLSLEEELRPEWLTIQDIESFERQMLEVS